MIVLIGATGVVGYETAKQLTIAGQKARAIVRDPMKAEGLRQLGHEVVTGDPGDPATLRPLLDAAEHLFISTDARIADTILDTAKAAHVRHVVQMSALGQSDAVLRESGLPFTILRPAYFMQNLLASPTLYLPSGDAKISMVDVRDVAAVAVKTLTGDAHVGQTYDLTGPAAVSGEEIAAGLSAAMGKPLKFLSDDQMFGAFREGLGAAVSTDVERVLGRKPISFEQFAKDHAQVLLRATAN